MSKPTVAPVDHDLDTTTSPVPTFTSGSTYTIDDGGVQIAGAAADQGMGDYDFSPTTLTLALPADVYADTYASTVTLTSDTGP